MTLAEVRLWGRAIAAVSIQEGNNLAAFQYDPGFADSGIEVSPITMPLGTRIYQFPELSARTFHGLPGMLADSLPDKFGNALIEAWLARQGRRPESFNAVERLCYTGIRGMGALEFRPTVGPKERTSKKIEVEELVHLASEILTKHGNLAGNFHVTNDSLNNILRVGTSAGGARAKAVIAWNSQTNEIRSGQVPAGKGFGYWLLKFDGVAGNSDKDVQDPQGYGAIEFAYSLMAKAAGINTTECRLLEENGRRHFMTRRFDRLDDGEKLHMQSLCALAHFDFNQAGAYSYEQALFVIRQLNLPAETVEQQFRRMTFNIIARNQDDHVKNIAFLMDKTGQWSLSPAFDVTYSYNPTGSWTAIHQMSMNGKRDNFTLADFRDCAKSALMKRGRAEAILEQVRVAVLKWPEFAEQAQVQLDASEKIRNSHRLAFPNH